MPILYADDDTKALESWSEILGLSGYHVRQAPTYEEAERLLQSGWWDVAVIDLDLLGQGKGGRAGLELARRYGRSVPVIILTGVGEVEAARQALKHNKDAPRALDFVEKAAGPQELLKAVDDVLRRRIFVVHGRDVQSLWEVTDFLEARGLWPIILHNQPGLGRTIIEKFEDSSNVSFAVVLLTSDDLGGEHTELPKLKSFRPRARQNVIFELGYFIGKLGRARVAALCDDHEHIELPSDYSGVQFIPKDSRGEWRGELVREMRAAGIPVG